MKDLKTKTQTEEFIERYWWWVEGVFANFGLNGTFSIMTPLFSKKVNTKSQRNRQLKLSEWTGYLRMKTKTTTINRKMTRNLSGKKLAQQMKHTRLCWKVDEEKEQGECKQAYYCDVTMGFRRYLSNSLHTSSEQGLLHITLSVNHWK